MAGMNVRSWFSRVFGDCLKGRRNDEAYVDWVHCVDKEGTSRMALTPVPSIDISPVRLQPCAAATGDETRGQEDPVRWTETNRLVNAAAAWQIRRVMPIEAATLDEAELDQMTTPELAWRFKTAPILMVLRADNETLRQLPLELLASESFARLTLLERRAIHNVLAHRPDGWSEVHLSLYAERERELTVAANEEASGLWAYDGSGRWVYDSFYMVELPFAYSAYAQEPRDWHE
ncbi:hypothetical protein PHYPSEUDO_015158 [Phytophthora pseudosyringae]|uniref:Uncharacterized protein n=1 Tax=Phytophthora pseudosyringae TaxID=221518 RepID=A0A8T1W2R4_9STRA|nr:hypothetical protein PHYPSEUDO_015158 [Phytophthora pseudosyringae]